MSDTLTAISPRDPGAWEQVDALLRREGIRRDRNLDYTCGIAVNPLRPDLAACLDKAGIPHVSIEWLKEKAYSLVGRPDSLEWEEQVVAILEARDGTILDIVRKIRPPAFS